MSEQQTGPALRRALWPLVVTLAAAMLVASCGRDPAPWEHSFAALGTEFRIVIPASEERRQPQAHFEVIEQRLRQLALDLDPWADGELAALNASLAAGRTFRASDDLVNVVSRARTLATDSGGRFDPGIGRLVELWGLHEGEAGGSPQAPAADAVAALLDRCNSIRHVTVRSREISSDCAGPRLDFGGIATGFALDQAMSMLRSRGVTNALVDAGGNARALGRLGRQPWRLAIDDPRGDGVLGVVELATGEAVFTVGRRHAGGSAQLLDPATGRPVTHTAGVTVLAGQGALADASAHALYVAGPADWRDVAERLGVRTVLRVDADGWTEMTRRFEERLEVTGPETK